MIVSLNSFLVLNMSKNQICSCQTLEEILGVVLETGIDRIINDLSYLQNLLKNPGIKEKLFKTHKEKFELQ